VCGNGVVEGSEQCDDGNTDSGDCCSSACGAEPPAATCETAWARASLRVAENKRGKETIVATMRKGPALSASDFGNPPTGSTSYALCIYDDAQNLVGLLAVDRAGDTCAGRACWRTIGRLKGYLYKDKLAASDGVSRIRMRAGAAGKSLLQVNAANKDKKGRT